MRKWLLLAALLPTAAFAQASQCRLPGILPRPHADGPTESQPVRTLPIGHYTLALTWSPQYCETARDKDSFQCAGRNGGKGGNRFGFTLHGLWPDGYGRDWPQYCRPAALLSQKLIREHLCSTPSVQLTQHEWAKHGTCTMLSPTQFLARSRALYSKIRFPDMAALASRDTLTAGDFATAVAAANPGMRADMMRITGTRDGWLDEIWLCLDKAYRWARCPAHAGGLPDNAALKVRAPG